MNATGTPSMATTTIISTTTSPGLESNNNISSINSPSGFSGRSRDGGRGSRGGRGGGRRPQQQRGRRAPGTSTATCSTTGTDDNDTNNDSIATTSDYNNNTNNSKSNSVAKTGRSNHPRQSPHHPRRRGGGGGGAHRKEDDDLHQVTTGETTNTTTTTDSLNYHDNNNNNNNNTSVNTQQDVPSFSIPVESMIGGRAATSTTATGLSSSTTTTTTTTPPSNTRLGGSSQSSVTSETTPSTHTSDQKGSAGRGRGKGGRRNNNNNGNRRGGRGGGGGGVGTARTSENNARTSDDGTTTVSGGGGGGRGGGGRRGRSPPRNGRGRDTSSARGRGRGERRNQSSQSLGNTATILASSPSAAAVTAMRDEMDVLTGLSGNQNDSHILLGYSNGQGATGILPSQVVMNGSTTTVTSTSPGERSSMFLSAMPSSALDFTQTSGSLKPPPLPSHSASVLSANQRGTGLPTKGASGAPTAFLDLPPPSMIPLTNTNRVPGIPIILSRAVVAKQVELDHDAHLQSLSERLIDAVLEDDTPALVLPTLAESGGTVPAESIPPETSATVPTTNEVLAAGVVSGTASHPPRKKVSKKKHIDKQKKKGSQPDNPSSTQAIGGISTSTDISEDISPTEALKALPARQVSITANTLIKIVRNDESSNSVNKDEAASTKVKPSSQTSRKKGSKKKSIGNDTVANQKAARRFNNEVRSCVERSDPDALRALLHDKKNHFFALDATVLETVLKATVMAAMFDDALYCLRHCTLPGTLSTLQTERILSCLPQNLRNSSAYTAADMISQLCVSTHFAEKTARTYFLRIARGVALEFLEEATSARDRICSSPCERLVRTGLCVVNARLERGKKPTELVVVPGDQLGVFVPDTLENRGIQAGDAVSILPYAGPYPISAESLDRNMIEATVCNTNPMVIRLQDKANADLHAILTEDIEGNVYRIDKLANRMGYNRQLSAAISITSPSDDLESNLPAVRDPRRPCPQLVKAITAMDESISIVLQRSVGGHLPRGGLTSTAALCAEAIPWSVDDETDNVDPDSIRSAARLALEKYGALDGLNASQQLAVEGATTNRLTLVQGPPGTGKTAVAIRILQHWAKLAEANSLRSDEPAPILATSDSNIAVDNLVEGCAAAGLRVVRLGRPEAIRPEILRFCIDRPPSRENGGGAQGYGTTSTLNFKERMKQLKNAQVVCCTCIGSGSDILDSLGPLERVLVDEATQATEPAILVPLMRGCRQLVLVGDHCQLPPTVLSTKAEEEGHGVPLFSRMVACGVPPFMLDTQYRMHPCISMFPSDLFYGGMLKNGVSAPERRPLAGFPWPREEFPVAFMPVQGVEIDDGGSKYNQSEAEAACHAVQLLLEGGQCSIPDIAVVTPYAAQARLIRRMLRGLRQNAGPPYIEVSSVDGFQGREKEAVVFSAVRSNDYGAIGFTSDWRRVNVSFTRARRALIVIGNDITLRRGDPDTWGLWLAWADAHGINMERPGISRGRYDAEQLRRVRGGTTAAEMLKDVLERQQAQIKTAAQQQERALRNAEGQIIALEANDDQFNGMTTNAKVLTLEEDLARMEKTDGNWDDSDDEHHIPLRHSVSRGTLASVSSSNDVKNATRSSTPVDAWDL